MLQYLLIAAVLWILNVAVAATTWTMTASLPKRSARVRAAAALLGALAGAWVGGPQLRLVVIDGLGQIQEHAGMTILIVTPFVLPVTSGLGAWLFSETAAGRSVKPIRAAALACVGGFFGSGLAVMPALVTPKADWLLGFPLLVIIALGASLGLIWGARESVAAAAPGR